MEKELYSIDKLLWAVDKYNGIAIPLCSKDLIKLLPSDNYDFFVDANDSFADELICEECKQHFKLPRPLHEEKEYVVEKIRAIDRKQYKIVDIDGIQTPVTKKIKIDPNTEYFCTTQIRDSKRGPQVVIYAGKKGSAKKSQIIITEEERRLSFDQKDINPADVFVRVIAEFRDGTKHIIEK